MSEATNLEPRKFNPECPSRGCMTRRVGKSKAEFWDNRKYTGENCKSCLRDTFKQTICPLSYLSVGKKHFGVSSETIVLFMVAAVQEWEKGLEYL